LIVAVDPYVQPIGPTTEKKPLEDAHMTQAERVKSYQELIERSVAASVQMLAGMIGDNPPESQADLWNYARGAWETAVRERLERGPTP
jgi:hypothetical protein